MVVLSEGREVHECGCYDVAVISVFLCFVAGCHRKVGMDRWKSVIYA